MLHGVSPKNYAAQALLGLKKLADGFRNMKMHADCDAVHEICGYIRAASHFSLPDGGVLLNEGLKGIADDDFRLPYEHTTIEFFVPRNEEIIKPGEFYCPKRLGIAVEMTAIAAKRRFPYCSDGITAGKSEDFVMVMSCGFAQNVWMVVPYGMLIPCRGWSGGRNQMKGLCVELLPESATRMAEKLGGATKAGEVGLNDVVKEATGFLELCEALSCRNVRAEPIQSVSEAVNARRVRDGKLPLFEVKTLVIDMAPSERASRGTTVFERSSPRQHLRRGHIRRLASGEKTWVQSCVVGTQEAGAILKTYAVSSKGKAA